MEALQTRQVKEGSDGLDCPSDDSHQGFVEDSFGQQVYSFSQIEGEYTLQQLVAMDVAKDPLLKKVSLRYIWLASAAQILQPDRSLVCLSVLGRAALGRSWAASRRGCM